MRYDLTLISGAAGFLVGLCLARAMVNLFAGKEGRFYAYLAGAAALGIIAGAMLAALW